jgi:hypothetical protein
VSSPSPPIVVVGVDHDDGVDDYDAAGYDDVDDEDAAADDADYDDGIDDDDDYEDVAFSKAG